MSVIPRFTGTLKNGHDSTHGATKNEHDSTMVELQFTLNVLNNLKLS